MRQLYYGGSFNPIHHAHLICARAAAEEKGFDRVLLVPNRQNPQKPVDATGPTAAQRVEMCRLAVASDPLFGVDEIELGMPAPSYTIDTARAIRHRDGGNVFWLIGADMAMRLPTWHQPANLLAEVHFVVMHRPGEPLDWTTLPVVYRHLANNVVTTPLVDISSTMIRDRVRFGRSIRHLTPDVVVNYIEDHGLYRRPTDVIPAL